MWRTFYRLGGCRDTHRGLVIIIHLTRAIIASSDTHYAIILFLGDILVVRYKVQIILIVTRQLLRGWQTIRCTCTVGICT